MSDLIRIDRGDHIALVRLLRVEKHNAFNRALSQEFGASLEELEADDVVRAVVLTGEGRAFSAGADMTEAVKAIDGTGRSEGMGSAIARAAAFRKPLLACVNGICYGGGALLAITCDIRIASEDAAFRFPGAAYGLVVGGSQLPRIVGPGFAKELLFTGRVVQADEALRMGLVNAVFRREEVEEASLKMAHQIAANSLPAVIATKEVVDRAVEVDDAVRLEAEWNAGLRQSAEHHERFKAAAERVASRPPAEA